MRYKVVHKTAYCYSEPASLSQNELFLCPRNTENQKLLNNRVEITPKPQYEDDRVDYFGNTSRIFMIQQPHNELTMTSISSVEVTIPAGHSRDNSPPWEKVKNQVLREPVADTLEASQFIFPSPLVTVNTIAFDYGTRSFQAGRPVLAAAVDLMNRIYSDFTYDKSATTVDTSVEQVFNNRRGVCQDFAHLFISCLRARGLPARYVSGYLRTIPPPGKPRLVGADASHAWVSVYVPGNGWVDLDPTNNVTPGESHITVAWGRDYGDVTPVKGVVMGGGIHSLSVTVDVSQCKKDEMGN
jgi:transglutaminase-like putative cysteine protease